MHPHTHSHTHTVVWCCCHTLKVFLLSSAGRQCYCVCKGRYMLLLWKNVIIVNFKISDTLIIFRLSNWYLFKTFGKNKSSHSNLLLMFLCISQTLIKHLDHITYYFLFWNLIILSIFYTNKWYFCHNFTGSLVCSTEYC